jgi:polyphenol oxidase
MLAPLTARSLVDAAGIAHGFFTRCGGVSAGIYASLNCGPGSGDDAQRVRENRGRVTKLLGAQHLITAHQVHGTTAVVAERPWASSARPRADAIVTSQKGLAIGVLTADCAPVLLADAEAGIVGAAHAGWRGAIAGVVEAAIAAMEERGAHRARVHAAVGPCIGQAHYEVGPEFEREFSARDPESAPCFVRAGDRAHFDLSGYLGVRLRRAQIAGVEVVSACTFAEADAFFSYRRAQARREQDYGRQISAIVLT